MINKIIVVPMALLNILISKKKENYLKLKMIIKIIVVAYGSVEYSYLQEKGEEGKFVF